MTSLWNLPRLPLTGIYLEKSDNYKFENFHDEELLYCANCTHMQLSNAVDPNLLYQETYTHRTSESQISTSGNVFLENVIRKILAGSKVGQILEIGCNDGLLLSKINDLAFKLCGFDPVLEADVYPKENVKLVGGYGEDIDYEKILDQKVDLVITAHTFEHIQDPRTTLSRLAPYLATDSDFIIEVPSSVSMVNQGRLDQVFPQHINHYTPKSLESLMSSYGFKLADIVHNFKYWGGTQVLWFTRKKNVTERKSNYVLDELRVKQAIALFESSMKLVSNQLNHGDFTRIGLGAAQMLPILKYHIGDAFLSLTCVVDDNPQRVGKYFPSIELPIVSAHSIADNANLQILITALDSSKALVRKALEMQATSVVVPNGLI
jgi:SAM-dependent methyltransferase